MKIPSRICFIYGALLILGGIMGFVMARSPWSLVTGVGGGVLCLVAGRGFGQRQSWALPLALVVAIAVAGFFAEGLNSPPAPMKGTTADFELAAKKREKAKTRAVGLIALSALTIIGLLATGTRRK